MQFKEILVNQTRENGAKNLISGLILVRLAQGWAPKTFFVGFISTRG